MNLLDPTAFIAWLTSNADGFQHNSEQLREQSRELWAAAAEHDRQAQALDAQITQAREQIEKLEALRKQVPELEAQRDAEQQKKEMRAAEAKKVDARAQVPETAAADIKTAIPVLKQAMDNANGQATPPPNGVDPADPAGPTRVDLSDDPRMTGPLDRFNEAHDDLKREEPEGDL